MDRLTLLKRQKTICDRLEFIPAGDGLPVWSTLTLDAKLPMVPNPRGSVVLYTTKLGEPIDTPKYISKFKSGDTCSLQKYRSKQSYDFDLRDPLGRFVTNEYIPLHDPHLKAHFSSNMMRRHLIKNGFITEDGMILCSLKEFNQYRQYLRHTYFLKIAKQRKEELNERLKQTQKKEAEIRRRASHIPALRRGLQQITQIHNMFKKTPSEHAFRDESRNKEISTEVLCKEKQGEHWEDRRFAEARKFEEARRVEEARRFEEARRIEEARRYAVLKQQQQNEQFALNWEKKMRQRDQKRRELLANRETQNIIRMELKCMERWEKLKEAQKQTLEKNIALLQQEEERKLRNIKKREEMMAKIKERFNKKQENLKHKTRELKEKVYSNYSNRLEEKLASGDYRRWSKRNVPVSNKRKESKDSTDRSRLPLSPRKPLYSTWNFDDILKNISEPKSESDPALMAMLNAAIDKAVEAVIGLADAVTQTEAIEKDRRIQEKEVEEALHKQAREVVKDVITQVKYEIYPQYLRMLKGETKEEIDGMMYEVVDAVSQTEEKEEIHPQYLQMLEDETKEELDDERDEQTEEKEEELQTKAQAIVQDVIHKVENEIYPQYLQMLEDKTKKELDEKREVQRQKEEAVQKQAQAIVHDVITKVKNEIYPQYLQMLEDEDRRQKEEAVQMQAQAIVHDVITKVKNEIYPQYLQMLEDKDQRQKEEAVQMQAQAIVHDVITKVKNEIYPQYLQMLEDEDQKQKEEAVQKQAQAIVHDVITKVKNEIYPQYLQMLEDEDQRQKEEAVQKQAQAIVHDVITKVKNEIYPQYLQMLEDEDQRQKEEAVQKQAQAIVHDVLTKVKNEIYPQYLQILEDEDRRQKEEALQKQAQAIVHDVITKVINEMLEDETKEEIEGRRDHQSQEKEKELQKQAQAIVQDVITQVTNEIYPQYLQMLEDETKEVIDGNRNDQSLEKEEAIQKKAQAIVQDVITQVENEMIRDGQSQEKEEAIQKKAQAIVQDVITQVENEMIRDGQSQEKEEAIQKKAQAIVQDVITQVENEMIRDGQSQEKEEAIQKKAQAIVQDVITQVENEIYPQFLHMLEDETKEEKDGKSEDQRQEKEEALQKQAQALVQDVITQVTNEIYPQYLQMLEDENKEKIDGKRDYQSQEKEEALHKEAQALVKDVINKVKTEIYHQYHELLEDETIEEIEGKSEDQRQEKEEALQKQAQALVQDVITQVTNEIYPQYLQMLEDENKEEIDGKRDYQSQEKEEALHKEAQALVKDVINKVKTEIYHQYHELLEDETIEEIEAVKSKSVRFSSDEEEIKASEVLSDESLNKTRFPLKPVSEHILTPVASRLEIAKLEAEALLGSPEFENKVSSVSFVRTLLLRLLDDLNNGRLNRDEIMKLASYCMDILQSEADTSKDAIPEAPDEGSESVGNFVSASSSSIIAKMMVDFTLSRIMADIQSGNVSVDNMASFTVTMIDSIASDVSSQSISVSDEELNTFVGETIEYAVKSAMEPKEDSPITEPYLDNFVLRTLKSLIKDLENEALSKEQVHDLAESVKKETMNIQLSESVSEIENQQDIQNVLQDVHRQLQEGTMDFMSIYQILFAIVFSYNTIRFPPSVCDERRFTTLLKDVLYTVEQKAIAGAYCDVNHSIVQEACRRLSPASLTPAQLGDLSICVVSAFVKHKITNADMAKDLVENILKKVKDRLTYEISDSELRRGVMDIAEAVINTLPRSIEKPALTEVLLQLLYRFRIIAEEHVGIEDITLDDIDDLIKQIEVGLLCANDVEEIASTVVRMLKSPVQTESSHIATQTVHDALKTIVNDINTNEIEEEFSQDIMKALRAYLNAALQRQKTYDAVCGFTKLLKTVLNNLTLKLQIGELNESDFSEISKCLNERMLTKEEPITKAVVEDNKEPETIQENTDNKESENLQDSAENKEPENIQETTDNKEPENIQDTTDKKEPEKIHETSDYKEPEKIQDTTDNKEPEMIQDTTDNKELEEIQKTTDYKEPEKIQDTTDNKEPEKILVATDNKEPEKNLDTTDNKEPEKIRDTTDNKESEKIRYPTDNKEPEKIQDTTASAIIFHHIRKFIDNVENGCLSDIEAEDVGGKLMECGRRLVSLVQEPLDTFVDSVVDEVIRNLQLELDSGQLTSSSLIEVAKVIVEATSGSQIAGEAVNLALMGIYRDFERGYAPEQLPSISSLVLTPSASTTTSQVDSHTLASISREFADVEIAQKPMTVLAPFLVCDQGQLQPKPDQPYSALTIAPNEVKKTTQTIKRDIAERGLSQKTRSSVVTALISEQGQIPFKTGLQHSPSASTIASHVVMETIDEMNRDISERGVPHKMISSVASLSVGDHGQIPFKSGLQHSPSASTIASHVVMETIDKIDKDIIERGILPKMVSSVASLRVGDQGRIPLTSGLQHSPSASTIASHVVLETIGKINTVREITERGIPQKMISSVASLSVGDQGQITLKSGLQQSQSAVIIPSNELKETIKAINRDKAGLKHSPSASTIASNVVMETIDEINKEISERGTPAKMISSVASLSVGDQGQTLLQSGLQYSPSASTIASHVAMETIEKIDKDISERGISPQMISSVASVGDQEHSNVVMQAIDIMNKDFSERGISPKLSSSVASSIVSLLSGDQRIADSLPRELEKCKPALLEIVKCLREDRIEQSLAEDMFCTILENYKEWVSCEQETSVDEMDQLSSDDVSLVNYLVTETIKNMARSVAKGKVNNYAFSIPSITHSDDTSLLASDLIDACVKNIRHDRSSEQSVTDELKHDLDDFIYDIVMTLKSELAENHISNLSMAHFYKAITETGDDLKTLEINASTNLNKVVKDIERNRGKSQYVHKILETYLMPNQCPDEVLGDPLKAVDSILVSISTDILTKFVKGTLQSVLIDIREDNNTTLKERAPSSFVLQSTSTVLIEEVVQKVISRIKQDFAHSEIMIHEVFNRKDLERAASQLLQNSPHDDPGRYSSHSDLHIRPRKSSSSVLSKEIEDLVLETLHNIVSNLRLEQSIRARQNYGPDSSDSISSLEIDDFILGILQNIVLEQQDKRSQIEMGVSRNGNKFIGSSVELVSDEGKDALKYVSETLQNVIVELIREQSKQSNPDLWEADSTNVQTLILESLQRGLTEALTTDSAVNILNPDDVKQILSETIVGTVANIEAGKFSQENINIMYVTAKHFLGATEPNNFLKEIGNVTPAFLVEQMEKIKSLIEDIEIKGSTLDKISSQLATLGMDAESDDVSVTSVESSWITSLVQNVLGRIIKYLGDDLGTVHPINKKTTVSQHNTPPPSQHQLPVTLTPTSIKPYESENQIKDTSSAINESESETSEPKKDVNYNRKLSPSLDSRISLGTVSSDIKSISSTSENYKRAVRKPSGNAEKSYSSNKIPEKKLQKRQTESRTVIRKSTTPSITYTTARKLQAPPHVYKPTARPHQTTSARSQPTSSYTDKRIPDKMKKPSKPSEQRFEKRSFTRKSQLISHTTSYMSTTKPSNPAKCISKTSKRDTKQKDERAIPIDRPADEVAAQVPLELKSLCGIHRTKISVREKVDHGDKKYGGYQ